MALFVYPPTTIDTTGLATEVKQDLIIAELVDVNTELDTISGKVATEAKQDVGNASLSSLDGKIALESKQDTQITEAQSTNTKIDTTNTKLDLVATEVTAAATQVQVAELNAKLPAGFVPDAFDYVEITYVGATTNINTATYKTGGAAGSTVAVLTLGYDGSDRLTSVTKV